MFDFLRNIAGSAKNALQSLISPSRNTPAAAPKPTPAPVPKPTASKNVSGVPGLSSNTNLTNVKFGQAQPLDLQKALRSGGLTPNSDPNNIFPQGQVLGDTTSGGGGGGGGYQPQPAQPSPEEIAENFIKTAFTDVYDKFFSNVDSTEPFSFDEELAKNAAIQQYSPYYAQTLQQFMRGVRSRAARSQEDTAKMLQELQAGSEFFSGRTRRMLDLAQEEAGRSFEERGLGSSGEAGRAQGLLAVERNRELQNFLQGQERKSESVNVSQQRILEDLLGEQRQRETDLGRSQAYEVDQAVQQARNTELARQSSNQLAATGPTPGQSYGDYLSSRGKTLQQFLLGGA